MMQMTNGFKAALAQGRVQIGLWLAMAAPYSAELCANAGFDWLLLDGEHSPLDLRTVLAQLQAIAAYPSHVVVRPPVGDPVLIKQLLDIGATSLLVPMVETEDQARMLVTATRYPPKGIRGVGAGIARAARWGYVRDYLQQADEQVCLLLQVETRRGLENLDGILTVADVDGIFLGAADLSASLGHLGNPSHPEVMEAMSSAVARIRAAGKAVGVLTTNQEQAEHFLSLGCQFVAVGVDTLILAQATRQLRLHFAAVSPVEAEGDDVGGY